ncbi:MAG: AMP nucleosidase [Planctomycetota bacterium]|nr:MAG: AMP nucleosidase [Planctomycetota bacterium]
MNEIYAAGHYPRVTVVRSWSGHNPAITGEVARPASSRWYLLRELKRLVAKGATLTIEASRPIVTLDDASLLERVDEHDWDLTRKKLFLFAPERVELSIERLEHYTGTQAAQFQRYVLLSNYAMHMDAFAEAFPGCVRPEGSVQMPAFHHVMDENLGVSIVNIGVGPSNAKNFTDHLAVLRPDAMIMVGHCGGIRNHQAIGDYVLASGYMRADRVLDDLLPLGVPIAPSFLLNTYLSKALEEAQLNYRLGTVYTTADRNWELALRRTRSDLQVSRSVAIDMESATVAANGFRYRIPNATLLCVSDKPLHGRPKLGQKAVQFYRETKQKHLSVAIRAMRLAKADWPTGLPNASIRALDEPLMGGSIE